MFTACAVASVPCVSHVVRPLDPSVLFSSGAVLGHTCSCTWQVWVPRELGREGLAVDCPCPSSGTCDPSTEASRPPVPGTAFICALGSASGRAGERRCTGAGLCGRGSQCPPGNGHQLEVPGHGGDLGNSGSHSPCLRRHHSSRPCFWGFVS